MRRITRRTADELESLGYDVDESEVVDDAEVSSGAFISCIPAEMPSSFPDNVFAHCGLCDCAIQHRPYLPVSATKICLACVLLVENRQ